MIGRTHEHERDFRNQQTDMRQASRNLDAGVRGGRAVHTIQANTGMSSEQITTIIIVVGVTAPISVPLILVGTAIYGIGYGIKEGIEEIVSSVKEHLNERRQNREKKNAEKSEKK